jgi:hypothetical protein
MVVYGKELKCMYIDAPASPCLLPFASYHAVTVCILQNPINLSSDLTQILLERLCVLKLPMSLGFLDERFEQRFLF